MLVITKAIENCLCRFTIISIDRNIFVPLIQYGQIHSQILEYMPTLNDGMVDLVYASLFKLDRYSAVGFRIFGNQQYPLSFFVLTVANIYILEYLLGQAYNVAFS